MNELSDAERELLELLRGQDAAEFDFRVTVRAGHWFVSLSTPSVKGLPAEGEGKGFAEAWADVKPYWAD
jgi:hypothetical protein